MRKERFRAHRDDHRAQRIGRRIFYWVCAIEKVSGRPVLQGPHSSEVEANQYGFEHIKDGDFTVEAFPTVDRTAARDFYKNKMLQQSGQLADVFKRARYMIP